jgi:hypothetical protein
VINFRYHVVSLTAVFMALAIGLVLGTTALNGAIADQLRDQVTGLGQQNQEYRDRINHLEDDVASREAFATAIAPALLDGQLAGNRVLVVSLPSGGNYVEDVVGLLTTADATVAGRLEIKDKFTDPAFNDELLDLAHTAQPPGIGATLPTNTDGVEASAALLAAVLLDRTPTVSAEDRQRVLEAYRGQGYLSVAKEVTTTAEVVVVISGPPVTDKEAPRKNLAVVTMVDQLDQAGNVVVAATSDAGEGNVVAQLRGDPRLKANVSTVDNVSTPQGRLVTVLAVVNQLAGRPGHYGIGAGATLLPKTTQ